MHGLECSDWGGLFEICSLAIAFAAMDLRQCIAVL